MRNELNRKYSMYCNVNNLVHEMKALLTTYGHRNSENGICIMLDKFFKNKLPLIEMMMKSPNYVGDLRVVCDITLPRELDMNEVYRLFNRFTDEINTDKIILKTIDSDGKTMNDYLKTGVSKLTIADLANADIMSKLNASSEGLDRFTIDGYTRESKQDASDFKDIIWHFRTLRSSTIPESLATGRLLTRRDYHIHKGMKTGRAFNKICTYHKINEHEAYNRLFAKYSDLVTGGERNLKFIISVNPLDYLTMSFGKNWTSCHTIDKSNRRRVGSSAYHGQYCGGTVSYMMDKTSIITYVNDKWPMNIEDGKIYRNMFHYNDGTLIQSRVYPQANDGATDLYDIFRASMQNELSKMLQVDPSVWKFSGERPVNYAVRDNGVHYPDYIYNDSCNVSYFKLSKVQIGAKRVCPNCGRDIEDSEMSANTFYHKNCSVPISTIKATVDENWTRVFDFTF